MRLDKLSCNQKIFRRKWQKTYIIVDVTKKTALVDSKKNVQYSLGSGK